MILRPEQYPDPPRFLHGHNPVITHKKTKPEPQPCACDCGQLAGPRKRFVSGHNSYGRVYSDKTREKLRASKLGELNPQYGRAAPNAKPPKPTAACACGCGQLATPGRRFISGHNTLGTRLPNYRGRYKVKPGYILIHDPDHPYANHDGYVFEHRLVVEQHLQATEPGSPYLIGLGDQSYLRPDFVVHHIDGTKDNNEISNLRPMTVDDHTRLHHEQGDIIRH